MNTGFVSAGEPRVGSEVINSQGDVLFVDDIHYEAVATPVTVYNFQVEDFHTYHVGVTGVLVHNADCTAHGSSRAESRGFTDKKIEDIQANPTQKVYQSEGRTVYAKKTGNHYDVVITNSKGEVITCVGGNTNSLPNWNAVEKMLNNNGGYSYTK